MKNTIFYIALIVFNSCSFAQKDNRVEWGAEFKDSAYSEVQLSKFELDSTLCGLNFIKGSNYQKTKNEIA